MNWLTRIIDTMLGRVSTVSEQLVVNEEFSAWLNATRIMNGRDAIGIELEMIEVSIENNRLQLRKGLGHYYMGNCKRQNSGQGFLNIKQAAEKWMGSHYHKDALLDPTIKYIGVAFGMGEYWTFSAR